MVLVPHPPHSYDRHMAEAIAFDTHRFVKRLTESGFTEKQAETLAEEHVALLNANLATKVDIAEVKADIARVEAGVEALRQETKADIARVEAGVEALRQETKADIARVEAGAGIEADIASPKQASKPCGETKAGIARVEARIEATKSDLLKWLFGAMIAQGGLIVALVKLL